MKVEKEQRVKGWREVEREFKATRDPRMKVTLPRLRCLAEPGPEGEEGSGECES